ncbi:PIN domain-containing protein [Chitinimonas koreensis]|uniref:PIN domain-containing protein n=1 Tax=Chitinimonas koreensis TaxID=356302 RepID=UPI00040E8C4D|nr:type II toxin-antitoxin system VapC family toxin [Chitinimonas koreensis]QNM97558.1 type II toxin-antitoxin system VapC family toxin [Chitinimonas koreensis]
MIGLDTNVLLRLLVVDDEAQTRTAKRLLADAIARGEPMYCNLLVLAEFAWVLSRSYGYDRGRVAEAIDALLNVALLEIERDDLIEAALADAIRHNADFADALIGCINREAGCAATWTFDRRATRLATHTLLT